MSKFNRPHRHADALAKDKIGIGRKRRLFLYKVQNTHERNGSATPKMAVSPPKLID